MRGNSFLKKLGIENPVICAPMGGGPSTPELVAAVSSAGGLGCLAAAYLTPEQITADIARVRSLTTRPFCVNLFAGGYRRENEVPTEPMREIMRPLHQALGLPPPAVPILPENPFPAQFEAVIAAHPPVFSFTFGVPGAEAMTRLRAHGIVTLGTATTFVEAMFLKEAGVDAIVAQGEEAGAHRGTFAGSFEESMVPTVELVDELVGMAPIIASGGIMDGRDMAKMLGHGASAVQMGTAFLACPESGASAAWKQAVLAATWDSTVVTRAFSGRPARGLRNKFITLLDGKEGAILPYPLQNTLTRPMRTAAAARGDADFLSLWAGRGVSRCRALPAADLVKALLDEMAALARAH
jgi:nitronate monooxygenase